MEGVWANRDQPLVRSARRRPEERRKSRVGWQDLLGHGPVAYSDVGFAMYCIFSVSVRGRPDQAREVVRSRLAQAICVGQISTGRWLGEGREVLEDAGDDGDDGDDGDKRRTAGRRMEGY